MRRWIGGAAVVLGLIVGTSAAATDLTAAGMTATMTYTTAAQASSARTYGSYTGVGSLFTSYASTATTNTGGLCTGALVSSNVMLTAAHCLYDYNASGSYDPVSSVSVYLPSFGERTAAETYGVSSYWLDPTYDGTLGKGNDIALVTLARFATGHDSYGIYAGDPLKAFSRVGAGTIGDATGTGGGGLATDYDQRVGYNLYEYYGSQVFGNVSHDVLMMDFDDGTAAHDAFASIGGRQQTGIGGEADSSPGDSGGPTFIDGLIAGVTSFGVSLGCGAGAADPYAGANGKCTNSSIGELAGDTWVAPKSALIANYVAAAAIVPEPSTWAMLLLGFGITGTALRRDRSRAFTRSSGLPIAAP